MRTINEKKIIIKMIDYTDNRDLPVVVLRHDKNFS